MDEVEQFLEEIKDELGIRDFTLSWNRNPRFGRKTKWHFWADSVHGWAIDGFGDTPEAAAQDARTRCLKKRLQLAVSQHTFIKPIGAQGND